jgi:stage III sporulation protein AD
MIGLALVAALLSVFLKESRLPALALLLVLGAGGLIFLSLLPQLKALLDIFASLTEKAGVSPQYFQVVLKVIGVAYIGEFGVQMCRDAGQGALALKIELAAKITILLLAAPLITSIVQSVTRLLT